MNLILTLDKNNIKITGTLYRKTSEELESTINYIKQYYSDEYLTPQIIIYDKNHIEKIYDCFRHFLHID